MIARMKWEGVAFLFWTTEKIWLRKARIQYAPSSKLAVRKLETDGEHTVIVMEWIRRLSNLILYIGKHRHCEFELADDPYVMCHQIAC